MLRLVNDAFLSNLPGGTFKIGSKAVSISIQPNEDCGGRKTAEQICESLNLLSNDFCSLSKKTIPTAIAVVRINDILKRAKHVCSLGDQIVAIEVSGQADTLHCFLYPTSNQSIERLMQRLLIACYEDGFVPLAYLFWTNTSSNNNFLYTGDPYHHEY